MGMETAGLEMKLFSKMECCQFRNKLHGNIISGGY
jgi:hypothetical protein